MDDSPTHGSGGDDGAVSYVEVPAWDADAGGVGLRIEGKVAIGRRRASGGARTQLTCHFSRLVAPNSEDAHVTCRRHFDRLAHQPTWEEETRRILSSVAANHVRPADLELLAVAFSLYTFVILDRFSIAELVAVEIFAVIKVPAAPSTSSTDLGVFLPMEDYQYLHSVFGDDVGMGTESGGGPSRSASAAAVEALRTVTPEEPGACPICLDDFDAATQLLAMPCRHRFHEVCLKEWLKRSNCCPVCRFPLPVDAE